MHPNTQAQPTSLTVTETVVGAIPARLRSTRLPGKVLKPIAGIPMIEHVYRRALQARTLGRVVVLTDDEQVAQVVEGFGGEVQMTPDTCASGTDRIAAVAGDWTEDVVINIQGDEPLIDPEVLDRLAEHLINHPQDEMATLAAETDRETADSPDVVKVVTDANGRALYFSRATIPYARGAVQTKVLRHLGVYGYRRETLLRLASLPQTPLEQSESLEQLRALENDISIRVLVTDRVSPAVDTVEDLQRVEKLILAPSQ